MRRLFEAFRSLWQNALRAAPSAPAPAEPLCPACGRTGLTRVNFILATVLIDGRRAPDSWFCYTCRSCAARFKLYRNQWIHVVEEETQQNGAKVDSTGDTSSEG